MTAKEAVRAVDVLTYDECRQLRRRGSLVVDRMLRKAAGWRIHEPEAWVEIRDHVCEPRDPYTGGVYRQFGKRKASIVEVRERAQRARGAA